MLKWGDWDVAASMKSKMGGMKTPKKGAEGQGPPDARRAGVAREGESERIPLGERIPETID